MKLNFRPLPFILPGSFLSCLHGIARGGFTFDSLVEVAGKHNRTELETQVVDDAQERNAHRPPLGALVVDLDVGNRVIEARRVGGSAELAGNHHALDSPFRIPQRTGDVDRRAREVARESILVEEYDATVLGDHMEVLRQRTVCDEA